MSQMQSLLPICKNVLTTLLASIRFSIISIMVIALTSVALAATIDDRNDTGYALAIATSTLAFIGVSIYIGSIINKRHLMLLMLLIVVGLIILSYYTYERTLERAVHCDDLRDINHKERDLSLTSFGFSLIAVSLLLVNSFQMM